MQHSKIFKRENGTQYKVLVSFWVDSYGNNSLNWDITISCRLKGKHKWIGAYNYSSDYEWRALSMEERKKFIKKKQLESVTSEEILQTKLELWKMLKPKEPI